MVNPLEQPNLQPTTVPQQADEDKFKDFSAELEQITTRGDGRLEKGEEFTKEEIDFAASLEHLKIHHEGNVAGSQFNSNIFENPQDLIKLIKKVLPNQLNYDQYERAEISLEVSHNKDEELGWTGVKSVEDIQKLFPDAQIEQKVRMPGGEETEEDGIKGAWYPEMARNPESGRFEVVKDDEGNVKNPRGKFEPVANIATVNEDEFKNVAKTNRITVIISKDKSTQKPTVLTIYPGENAPMYPAKINSENFKLNTLKDCQEAEYWQDHAFIQTRKAEHQEAVNVDVEDRITPEKLQNLSTLETEIKADFSQVINQINQDKGIQLEPRPEGFHLTIIGPTESKVLKEMSIEQLNTLKGINERIQRGEGVFIDGIGFIDGSAGDNFRAADKEKKTCFLAVSIPELQEFRTSLGLPEKDLHVTLGFEKGDVHMEITGKNEKGKDILSPISKKADQGMDKYFELLNKDELKFGPLDCQEKEKKQEKPQKQEKAAAYDVEILKSNLDSLSDEIKGIIDVDKLVELAGQNNGKEINDEIKKLGPQLKANMRFVKEALQKSEK